MDETLRSFRPDLYAGRCILVSGASSGIGLVIAQGFARRGGEVVAGTLADKLDTAAQTHGGDRLRFASLDVRDTGAVTRFVNALPALDVLVNTAGIARRCLHDRRRSADRRRIRHGLKFGVPDRRSD